MPTSTYTLLDEGSGTASPSSPIPSKWNSIASRIDFTSCSQGAVPEFWTSKMCHPNVPFSGCVISTFEASLLHAVLARLLQARAVVSPDDNDSPLVLIVGGNAVVGRALEMLLRAAADFNVRFLTESSLDEPGLLDGVQLLLLTPGLGSKRYEALLTLVSRYPLAAKIPLLRLVSANLAVQDGEKNFVPWPCRVEELKERISAALLSQI